MRCCKSCSSQPLPPRGEPPPPRRRVAQVRLDRLGRTVRMVRTATQGLRGFRGQQVRREPLDLQEHRVQLSLAFREWMVRMGQTPLSLVHAGMMAAQGLRAHRGPLAGVCQAQTVRMVRWAGQGRLVRRVPEEEQEEGV